MTEVYVLVERKKSAIQKVLTWLVLAVGIIFVLFSLIAPLFLTGAMIILLLWYFFLLKNSKEYEYSFFDGELRFARIMNKSRRKKLMEFTMDEVLQIAPAGDRSIYKYEQDNAVKKLDYTSGNADTANSAYKLVRKSESGMMLISFEPDEKYLDAVCVKYSQKVIRRK